MIHRSLSLSLVPLVATGLLACAEGDLSPTTSPHRLAVEVAALELSGIDFACYDLLIENAAGDPVVRLGDPTRSLLSPTPDTGALCSTRYGDGDGGGISYVAPCDASAPLHTVTLWVDGLYTGTPESPEVVDYQDPCVGGCSQQVLCEANADAFVGFDLTILRPAGQGFFDVAVNFDDIFCSAKLDCEYDADTPIELLHHPVSLARSQTAVLALACTAGPARDAEDVNETVLFRDPIVIDCGGAVTTLDPSLGPGNVYGPVIPDPDPADAIWQYATYRGDEALDCGQGLGSCHKRYWNVAIGFDPTVPNCRLTTRMTAGEASTLPAFTTPPGAAYPVLEVDVVLTDASKRVCTQHPLNVAASGVATSYTPITGATEFCHRFDGGLDSREGCGAEPVSCGALGPCPAEFVCVDDSWCVHNVEGPIASHEVYVPNGSFWMGCNGVLDGNCQANEYPQHQVTLSAYVIDRTQVTAAAYATCVSAGGCADPTAGANPTIGVAEKEQHPINWVTWYQADTFCAWQDKRLCSEAEWERAGRGGCETLVGDCQSSMRKYPWGNWNPTGCNEANFASCTPPGPGPTSAVGSFPAGVSPYGAMDMSGNVNEWVNDWFGAYPAAPQVDPQGPLTGSYKVVRGGSFNFSLGFVRPGRRGSLDPPANSYVNVGFRCCRDLP